MNLTEYQIDAIVGTLEKEHKKFWAAKDKLTEKPPKEKLDKDGLTTKERDYLIAKNKKIRTALEKLPFEAKIELQFEGSSFFKSYHTWGKQKRETGVLESETNTLNNLIESYKDGKETKKEKNVDKPKKESGRIFNKVDVTRKVTLASIEANTIAEILEKVRKRENNKEILAKAKKAVPAKKLAKKK